MNAFHLPYFIRNVGHQRLLDRFDIFSIIAKCDNRKRLPAAHHVIILDITSFEKMRTKGNICMIPHLLYKRDGRYYMLSFRRLISAKTQASSAFSMLRLAFIVGMPARKKGFVASSSANKVGTVASPF